MPLERYSFSHRVYLCEFFQDVRLYFDAKNSVGMLRPWTQNCLATCVFSLWHLEFCYKTSKVSKEKTQNQTKESEVEFEKEDIYN